MAHPVGALLTSAAIAGAILAAGCATSTDTGANYKPLSSKQRAAIRSVSVWPHVQAPEYPRVFGPSARTASFIFGPLSLFTTSDLSRDPDAQAYKSFLRTHAIDIDDIVRKEFAARLLRMRAFPQVLPEGGDARFELTIEDYGLGPAMTLRPFHFPLKPTLRLRAQLMSRGGELLWQKTAFITAMNDSLESSTYGEVLAAPAWTQDGFKRAARIVATELLQDLGPHPESLALAPSTTPPSATRPQQPSPDDPLPAAGSTWTYSFVDRFYGRNPSRVTVRVLSVGDTTIQERVVSDAPRASPLIRVIGIREPLVLQFPLGGGAVMLELAPYLFVADRRPEDEPVVGYPQGAPNLSSWRIRAVEPEWQRVTVPAGTYRALRVEVVGERMRNQYAPAEAGRFRIVAWYAPEVKRLVKLEHETWSTTAFQPMGREVLELLSYSPPS